MSVAVRRPPYGAYAVIASTFAGVLAAAGTLAHLLHRDPGEHDALDLVVLGFATFKAARTIARDEVTSFLRDPFVEGKAHEGGEEPVETGDMRQAIGDSKPGARANPARPLNGADKRRLSVTCSR